jgi:signal transduction histidine kinase
MSSIWPPTSSAGELYGFFALVGVLVAVLGAAIAALASARPLRELARANAQIRAHVDELSHRRDELRQQIADVAHDVRTPIASLQLALEQALDADDPEAAQRDLRAVHDVVYVGGLIGNLRLASELRAGPLGAVSAVDLGEIVERAAVRAQFLARRKQIALEVALPDGGLTVTGDPIAIAQAVGNVIDNAVAHHHPGGHVAVVLETRAADFTLTVIDDGPGVDPTELPRLGERTFRSDAARGRDGRGQGLGLAITAEVCRRHHWTLAFTRELPQGLRVTITGPR